MRRGGNARRGNLSLSVVSRKPIARQIEAQFDESGSFDMLAPSSPTFSSSVASFASPPSPPSFACSSHSSLSSASPLPGALSNLSLSSQSSQNSSSRVRPSNVSLSQRPHAAPAVLKMQRIQSRPSLVDLTQEDSPPPKAHVVTLLSPEGLSPVLDTPPKGDPEETHCPTRQLSWSTQDFSQPLNPVKSLFASQSQQSQDSSPSTQPLTRTDSTGPCLLELSPSQEISSQASISALVPSQTNPFGPPASRVPRFEKNLSQKNKRDLEDLSQSSEVYYTPANQTVKEKSDAERSIDLMNARIPPTKKTKTSLLANATNMGEIPLSQEPSEIRPVSNNPFLLPWSETVKFLTEAKKLDEKSERRRDHASSAPQLSRSRFDLLFERLREIASGSFGSVTLCRKRVDGCLYAVKRTLRKIAVHESRN